MSFSKKFARTLKGSSFPIWDEIYLTDSEEKNIELSAKNINIELMKQCISDAKKIVEDTDLNQEKYDVIHIAITLFEKLSSHVVYHKENLCKEKFDKKLK